MHAIDVGVVRHFHFQVDVEVVVEPFPPRYRCGQSIESDVTSRLFELDPSSVNVSKFSRINDIENAPAARSIRNANEKMTSFFVFKV